MPGSRFCISTGGSRSVFSCGSSWEKDGGSDGVEPSVLRRVLFPKLWPLVWHRLGKPSSTEYLQQALGVCVRACACACVQVLVSSAFLYPLSHLASLHFIFETRSLADSFVWTGWSVSSEIHLCLPLLRLHGAAMFVFPPWVLGSQDLMFVCQTL